MAKINPSSIFLITLLLSGCIANHESRYHDNRELERPPTVEISKEDAEIADANQLDEPKSRHGKGMKSDVYMVEGSETRIRLKRPGVESWPLIRQALQLHELKIADEDRSNGVFYVVYEGGFLGSLFGNEEKKQTYLLKLEESLDGETEVVVSKANKEDQNSQADGKDGVDSSDDASSGLAEKLFDTLRDEVKED